VSGLEEWVLRRFRGTTILMASAVILAVGLGPLCLYVVFGPADGNPIGLGLLAVASIPVAVVGAVVGLVKLVVERFQRGG
jgi:hypothetical protein